MGLLARVKEYQNKTAHSEHRGGLLQKARELRERSPHESSPAASEISSQPIIDGSTPDINEEEDLFEEVQFSDQPGEVAPAGDPADILIPDEQPFDDDLDQITEIHLSDEIPDDEEPESFPDEDVNDLKDFLQDKQRAEDGVKEDFQSVPETEKSEPEHYGSFQSEKTAETESPGDAAEDESDEFAPRAGLLIPQVLAGLGSIPRGFEAPYMAWGILRDFLGIQQGALLLQDHAEDTLIPYSASGLTFDSLQKLRIESSDLKTMASPGRIRDPQLLELWKRHLSIREAELLEELVIIPMGKAENGLCILFKTPLFSLNDETLLIISTTLAEGLGKMLQNSRTILLNNISPRFIVSMNEFPKLLQDAVENDSSLILGLQLEQILNNLIQASPDALRKRVALDVMRVIGSIVQEDGAVTSDSDYIYILFSDIEDIDPQLIKEQLEFSIQQAFSTELPGIQFVEFQPREVGQILRHITRQS
ncbi:hypothetical protein [Salinispira pacifica]|uniref:Uncharacterized protein n=1 Tax=Salinispira pacifica TaxID=1307761 RepID=V5WHD4_9SPIO|nr:hypothetical protein [Salinispira pacifica]AHC15010.1 hypothetical protein L21SP2_1625 [Salinispira pacifica]